MKDLVIKIKKTRDNAIMPAYMTDAAAGMDIYSANEEDILLLPDKRVLAPTGIAISLPIGFEAQIRPRSGLAHKHGVTVLNSPGTIDSDYRGEIMVLLINLGEEPFVISGGMRIAQMVFSRICQGAISVETELDETQRGSGGFGHTGHK